MTRAYNFIVLTILISLSSTAFAQFCEGALFTNLIPGDTAIVVVEGDTLNVRDEPGLNGSRITELEPDTEIRITAGPRCMDGYAWYQAELEDGQLGWMAESSSDDYFLGKLPRNYIEYTTPEDIEPALRFTYVEGSIEHIMQDANFAHGQIWDGTSTVLYTADSEMILINVIAVEELMEDDEHSQNFKELFRLIESRSDEAFTSLPDLPNTMGEPRQLITQQSFVDFQNGTGIRYVAFYALDEMYARVSRDSFEYTFHGLTDDGQYYVNVVAHDIAAPELPPSPPENPDDMSAYFEGYDDWLTEVEAFLNSIEPASFAPRFGMIQGLVQSLEVDPLLETDD